MSEVLKAYMNTQSMYVDPTSEHYSDRIWEEYHTLKSKIIKEQYDRNQIENLLGVKEAEVSSLTLEVENLQMELQEASYDYAKLEDEVDNLKTSIEFLTSTVKSMTCQINELFRATSELSTTVKSEPPTQYPQSRQSPYMFVDRDSNIIDYHKYKFHTGIK